MTTLEKVLDGLMTRYQNRVPDVKKIVDVMIQKKLISTIEEIENDHIAFRTLGVPHLGIQSLEKIFLNLGYKKRDTYHFEQKKLKAFWYEPPKNSCPRIFISQLLLENLSSKTQKIIHSYTNEVLSDPVDKLTLKNAQKIDSFLHTPLWRTPTWEDYETVRKESEYGAWVLYNRYYLNHFTLSVHNLPEGFNTIQSFNSFLEKIGILLNDSNGKIKISSDKLLLQSSSIAQMLPVKFPHKDGSIHTHKISGSYVEFAERRILPEYTNTTAINRKHRRDGFDSNNADKIFESTYTTQTDKKSVLKKIQMPKPQ